MLAVRSVYEQENLQAGSGIFTNPLEKG